MASFFTNQFTGGMNEVVSPALLDEKSAALLYNTDLTTGKISSIKMPLKIEASSPEQLRHYGSVGRSVVKWYERRYWSENNSISSPYYGGDVENYLGIPYPDYNKNVVISKVEGELTGEYKYCVTFVNINGWESAPGAVLDYEREVTLDKNFATVTVSWDDAKIHYAKIYRTADHGADFFCVGEVTQSGEKFVDKTTDYTLAGLEPLGSIDNYPPPEKGKYLCESGGVFFLAVGSTLHFSVLGNPHAWPLLNFIDCGDIITGITPEFQGVLVFTANNTYRITGADSAETLTKSLLPGNQGCASYNSIAQISNAPVWLSNDGICLWNGESVNVISRQIMNTTRLQVVCAVSANDCYFLFLEQGAIVYDHRNGDVFSKLDFTCQYSWYDADGDVMYLQQSDGIKIYGAGQTGTYTYLSPEVAPPEAEYNYIREVVIVIDGKASVTLSQDGKSVFSVALKTAGKHRLKAPYNTLCRNSQVKVVGTGTLREIGVIYS